MLITISGLPGSGKTTVARLVSKRLGLKHIYAGDLFRKEADRRGVSLEAFAQLAESDHEIDGALDRAMLAIAREGNVVLEGRLAGFMAHREGLRALKVRLEADEVVRAERIAKREGARVEEVLVLMQARERSDARRYSDIYGFDYYDRGLYDLVIETDTITPEEAAAPIAARATAEQG